MTDSAGESLEHFTQRRPRSKSRQVTVWRVWCLFWAATWLLLGLMIWPLLPLSLLSVGAALIPWGGDRTD